MCVKNMDVIKYDCECQTIVSFRCVYKTSTLRELRHISTILTCSKPYSRMRFWLVPRGINTSDYASKTPIVYDQSQRTMRKVRDILRPSCGFLYQQCFQTMYDFSGVTCILTLPTRLHRIFESVLKRWISSSFRVFSIQNGGDVWTQTIYIAWIA
mgnify:CR=1 FL=1